MSHWARLHMWKFWMPLRRPASCKQRKVVGYQCCFKASLHQLLSWQRLLKVQGLTFPDHDHHTGTGCKVLPMVTVGLQLQGPPIQADKRGHDPLAGGRTPRPGPRGLLSWCPPWMLSLRSPVLCRHPLGPTRTTAAVVIGHSWVAMGWLERTHVLSVLPSRVQLLQHPVQGQPRYTVPEKQEPLLSGVIEVWSLTGMPWRCCGSTVLLQAGRAARRGWLCLWPTHPSPHVPARKGG